MFSFLKLIFAFIRPRGQQTTTSTFGNSVGSLILSFMRASAACLFNWSRDPDVAHDLGHDWF